MIRLNCEENDLQVAAGFSIVSRLSLAGNRVVEFLHPEQVRSAAKSVVNSKEKRPGGISARLPWVIRGYKGDHCSGYRPEWTRKLVIVLINLYIIIISVLT